MNPIRLFVTFPFFSNLSIPKEDSAVGSLGGPRPMMSMLRFSHLFRFSRLGTLVLGISVLSGCGWFAAPSPPDSAGAVHLIRGHGAPRTIVLNALSHTFDAVPITAAAALFPRTWGSVGTLPLSALSSTHLAPPTAKALRYARRLVITPHDTWVSQATALSTPLSHRASSIPWHTRLQGHTAYTATLAILHTLHHLSPRAQIVMLGPVPGSTAAGITRLITVIDQTDAAAAATLDIRRDTVWYVPMTTAWFFGTPTHPLTTRNPVVNHLWHGSPRAGHVTSAGTVLLKTQITQWTRTGAQTHIWRAAIMLSALNTLRTEPTSIIPQTVLTAWGFGRHPAHTTVPTSTGLTWIAQASHVIMPNGDPAAKIQCFYGAQYANTLTAPAGVSAYTLLVVQPRHPLDGLTFGEGWGGGWPTGRPLPSGSSTERQILTTTAAHPFYTAPLPATLLTPPTT